MVNTPCSGKSTSVDQYWPLVLQRVKIRLVEDAEFISFRYNQSDASRHEQFSYARVLDAEIHRTNVPYLFTGPNAFQTLGLERECGHHLSCTAIVTPEQVFAIL